MSLGPRHQLRDQVRSADPARHLAGYDEERYRATLSRILADAGAHDWGTHDAGAQPPAATGGPAPHRSRRSLRSRRSITRLGVAAAAAAAVAGAIVGPALVTGRDGGASAASAAVLHRAAAVVAADPPAAPHQYWRIVTTGTVLSAVMTADRPGQPGRAANYLVSVADTDYVAVDGSRPTWTVRTRGERTTQLSGAPGAAPPATEETWTSDLAPTRQPAGWQTPTPAFLARLPRDPAALRSRLYHDVRGHGRSEDGEVLVYVADVLRSGLVPADLRAALYRTLETVPGVQITGSAATVAGRTGIAIGRMETVDGQRQEIVIDPATGELIGERELQVRAGDGLPAGTVVSEVRVTRTVVDDVPADVRTRASHQHCLVGPGGSITCRGQAGTGAPPVKP